MRVFECSRDKNELEHLRSEISQQKSENLIKRQKISDNEKKTFILTNTQNKKKYNIFSCLNKCDEKDDLFTVNFNKSYK